MAAAVDEGALDAHAGHGRRIAIEHVCRGRVGEADDAGGIGGDDAFGGSAEDLGGAGAVASVAARRVRAVATSTAVRFGWDAGRVTRLRFVPLRAFARALERAGMLLLVVF
jgi:hypothetical protein